MSEKRLIEFTTDGLRVPYRRSDGAEINVIVQYAGICKDRVTVSGERGTNVPKEVFGVVLRALYGEEPRFENPAPPAPEAVDKAEESPTLPDASGTEEAAQPK